MPNSNGVRRVKPSPGIASRRAIVRNRTQSPRTAASTRRNRASRGHSPRVVPPSGFSTLPDGHRSGKAAPSRRSLRSRRRREKVRVRESNRSQTVGLASLGRCDWQGSISVGFAPLTDLFAATKSGCENRTRVSASTRLKDNHYPNPDTLTPEPTAGWTKIRYDSRTRCVMPSLGFGRRISAAPAGRSRPRRFSIRGR